MADKSDRWRPTLEMDSDEVGIWLLDRVNAQVRCGVVLATSPTRMRSTDNPYYLKSEKRWLITKRQILTCDIGGTYGDAVRRARKREAERNSQDLELEGVRLWPFPRGRQFWRARKRLWGVGSRTKPFALYQSELYLDVQFISGFRIKYVIAETGEEVPLDELRRFLPAPRDQTSQQEHQGLEKVIQWKNFKLESVRWLNVFGEKIAVTPASEAKQQREEQTRQRRKAKRTARKQP